jgi:diacylglycerol O-acyltransferase / trehalose O-mycolyltransferase
MADRDTGHARTESRTPRNLCGRAHRTGPVLLIGVLALLAAPTHALCDPPRCSDVVVPLPKKVSVPDSTVRVLLPADYSSTRKRYPVLYLLHGAGDTFATWTERTDVEDFSAQFPLIIVMPDGGHDANAGFYSDWADGSRQWETFHTSVMKKYIDRHFRTKSSWKHRAVAGLSMGGFGAMSYTARHHHLFHAAASFSGAVDTLYLSPANDVLFLSGVVSQGVWGDPVVDEQTWRAHNPPDLAASLSGVALFVASGDGTMGGPAGDISNDPGAYAAESVILQMNLLFTPALDAAGVPYSKDFYQGGYHGWPYWQRELHWALPQIMAIIG